jgi:hypothetical protein
MNKLFYLFIILSIFINVVSLNAQYPNHTLPQYPRQWNSRWITHPDIDKTAHGMIHFRQKFTLSEQPEQFIVHVSGDNRYRLYVNNREVCYGPQLGDLRHWHYETLDLAPYLSEGQNIIAAEVMNWGVERSYGIISFKTAFLLQGHSEKETFLNTGYNSNWKVWKNEGIYEKTVHWIGGGDIIGGFYAANPTDSIVASQYPWDWKNIEYDERDWKDPEIIFSQPKTNAGAGHGWILQPRTTATQKNSIEPFGQIIRSDLQDGTSHPSLGEQPLVIPANSHHKMVIDQGYVTLGYPQYQFSKGKDAVIRIKYSEAMYDANNQKGHRDETDGKRVVGISDVYAMDGGDQRTFQPIWFRTFRFIEIDVKTKGEPLILENAHNVYSAASFPVLASFETDQPIYDEVWDLCWHTMKICAQDNLMSDAYYEQMQYVGDLRPHLKGWTALTGDFTYFKSALEQFNNSRLPDGNITSCYPLKATFVHPTYSLIWIDMLHDLMMLDGDEEYIGSFTGEIQEVFDYYESLINENGLVGKSEYHMFVDWYLPKGGNSPVNGDGNSAILTLNYAYTLKNAAEILDWLGDRSKANHYRVQSRKYAEIARKLCFDEKRGLYADDPEKTFYDQRASILAALCDAHNDQEAKLLMQNALDDDAVFDSKANLFYYFYLFEAMEKTGVGNFTEQLQPWQDIVAMGMSGTPEKRIEQHPRSEIHPWTAHPVHYYFSLLAGIRPASPGFQTVEIVPNPGDLKNMNASYPTVNGLISVKIGFVDGKATGEVNLPDQVSGYFQWNGKSMELRPGSNVINDF